MKTAQEWTNEWCGSPVKGAEDYEYVDMVERFFGRVQSDAYSTGFREGANAGIAASRQLVKSIMEHTQDNEQRDVLQYIMGGLNDTLIPEVARGNARGVIDPPPDTGRKGDSPMKNEVKVARCLARHHAGPTTVPHWCVRRRGHKGKHKCGCTFEWSTRPLRTKKGAKR